MTTNYTFITNLFPNLLWCICKRILWPSEESLTKRNPPGNFSRKDRWQTDTLEQSQRFSDPVNLSEYCLPRSCLLRLKRLKQRTQQWENERRVRIPSSLVQRAVSCTDSYLDYYGGSFCENDIGHLIEAKIIEAISSEATQTGLIVHPNFQWLRCSPNGFRKSDSIPIEVKTTQSVRPIRDVIITNYHQLQFELFCCQTDKIILIYYSNQQLKFAFVYRDDLFISKCLSKLKWVFVVHHLRNLTKRASEGDLLQAVKRFNGFSDISTAEVDKKTIKKISNTPSTRPNIFFIG